MTLAPSHRSVCRLLFRHFRRLGPDWAPKPPASDLLWGRGFPSSSGGPHPLLARVAPRAVQAGLAHPGPFAAWVRNLLRGPRLDTEVLEEVLHFVHRQRALAVCTAVGEQNGLRVEAVSGFVKPSSEKNSTNYVFAYNMRFTNVGQRPLRVLAREYEFFETSGSLSSQIKFEQPESAGVVGYTPLLKPGSSFEFGSGVQFRSSSGTVIGKFLVIVEPKLDGVDMQVHEAMEGAELMLRRVYYEGLRTEVFTVHLDPLHFDSENPCATVSFRPHA